MKKVFLQVVLLFIFSISYAQTVTLDLFADGFSSPIDIQNAGDDRLFVVEQAGVIKIINPNGTTNATPFLDITSQVSSGGERGLLSVVFHPDYATNGFFFVNYTDNSGDTQVSRFTVDAGDPNIADPSTELPIINVTQPFANHNGGCIEFGPDGYLYIGTGDGGSGGDPGDRAQNLLNALGKMLRLDIDNATSPNNYAIPVDNPYVGNPDGLDEIWAHGLRNPWKFSFDETTENLWIGDVGQNTTEEINRVSSTTSGYNFGWRCYEGSNPFNTTDCPAISELTFPVAEYPIPPCFCNVVGGYVYRGTVYSDIQGVYIFATTGDGTISILDGSDNITNLGDFNGGQWVSFGEDINKELYIVDILGGIYKVQGGVLSIPDNAIKDSFSIVPNPASEIVKITSKTTTIKSIELIDIKGSVVFSEENVNTLHKEISLQSVSKGLYLVKIISENGANIIKKLVIK